MAEPLAKKTPDTEKDGSMEEILQSIRRIIAEEDDAPVGSKEGSVLPGSNILELTEVVEEEPPVELTAAMEVPPPPPAAPVSAPAVKAVRETPPPAEALPAAPRGPDVLQSIDNVLTGNPPKPVETPAKSLIEPAVEQAAAAAFRAALMPEAPAMSSPAFRHGATVEDVVVEAIRPLLKQWLDANLPAIVERVVEREVHRVAVYAGGGKL